MADLGWPLLRQLTGLDRLGLGSAAKSAGSRGLAPRTATADKVVKSVCPYCGVGCAQDVYVADGKVIQIEGDPDSPISRGGLCPKGSASLQLTTGSGRRHDDPRRSPVQPHQRRSSTRISRTPRILAACSPVSSRTIALMTSAPGNTRTAR